MAPAIFKRQLAAGAWAITLATAVQSVNAFAHGITRVFMANQLVGNSNLALIADAIAKGLEFYCLVDSVENVLALGHFFQQKELRLNVLIELGIEGGRCGCRTTAQVDAIVAAISEQPALALVGVEGYEGLISGENEIENVHAYANRLVSTVRTLKESGVLETDFPIISGAGSKWFDIIADAFTEAGLHEHYLPLLRPGCYVVHDHRLYTHAMEAIRARHPELKEDLQPALEIFAHIQSLPEPGLAIVALGKRDIGHEPDLPLPLRLYHTGENGTLTASDISHWEAVHIMDQHTFINIPEHTDAKVGDVIAFGTSHPCLTFDKWRRMLVVKDNLDISEIIETCF